MSSATSAHGRPPPSLGGGAPPFVGRARELAALEQALRDATAGRPRVVLVQGEAGIGKSRLLQETMAIARRISMEVWLGRFHEDFALPYLPFVEYLLPRLEQLPAETRRSVDAEMRPVKQLLERARVPAEVGPSVTSQADHEKLQLFLAVSHATVRLTQSRPTLFVMDDLQWADQLSLDLLEHVAFTVIDAASRESVPLVIVGTHRPLAPEDRFARLVARLQREEACRTIALGGLAEPEIHDLIGGLGVPRPSHQLTMTVSDATRGNPLFIQEVLHHLVEQDALQEQGGYVVTTTAASELRLPDQVTGAIVTRAGSLSEACRRALTFASLLGDRFTMPTLAAISGAGEDDLLNALEEAMRQRLLRNEGAAFQFAHPLIRHVFYQEPSVPRRQRLHKQVAERLQALYGEERDAHVLELAHHLVKAGPAGGEEAVALARRAADQAVSVFAWSEAAYYFEAALSAGEATRRLDVAEQAELHYRAGLAHYYDQDVGPCLHHYERAIDLYRQAGDVRGLAQALMEKARTHFTLATVPFGTVADLKPLEEAAAALGEGEAGLRGHIMAVIAEAYRNGRQAEKAKAKAQEALDIGRRLGDDLLSAYASFALALAFIGDLHVGEALDGWQNALVYARRAGDVLREGWALHRVPLALTLLGRLEETDSVSIKACEVTRGSQDWGNHSLGLSHLASVAVARGQFDAAERWAHETMLMVSRSRYPWGGFRSLLALTCARTLRGAWIEAEDALDVLMEPGRVFDDAGLVVRTFARVFREVVRAQSGAPAGDLTTLAKDLMAVVGTDTYSVAPLCALVELADLAKAPAIAELPHRALATGAARGVLFSSGWMYAVPRMLGAIAAVNHRWDVAEAHLRTAIDVTGRAGAVCELGRSYLDHARMLVARGDEADRPLAIESLRLAFPILVDLGMHPSIEQAKGVAQALRVRLPVAAARPSPHPDDLSEREVDVLVRMSQGHSRQKIAHDLVLAGRTVASHVSSILQKIGVSDEAAATAYSREQGLQPRAERARRVTPELARAGRNLRTLLVTDIVASGDLIRRAGDARAHELFRMHNAMIRRCLAAHAGREVAHTGDGIEAAFQSASDAVDCAIAIQQTFAAHNRAHPTETIQVRIGVNAGEAITTEGRLFGTAVHATFGICTQAQPGEILVSEVVHQLVAGKGFLLVARGRLELKGLGRVRVYGVGWQ